MSHEPKPKKKSPLKDAPLRLPGQSADAQIFDVIYDQRLTPAVMVSCCLVAMLMELLFWIKPIPRSTSFTIMLVYTLIAIAYAVRSWRRSFARIAALRLGRDGERAVAEVLSEQLRRGNAVFHDIVGPSFNLDHVIVAPQGIYAIETKTLSKPTRSDAVVTFDGTTVLVDGKKMDRDPIEQSLAQIRWLRDQLRESTGTDLPVKGIVVFPGWFVKSDRSNADGKVSVMNPKGIDGFISAGHAILPMDRVHLAAFHLSRFIRSSSWA